MSLENRSQEFLNRRARPVGETEELGLRMLRQSSETDIVASSAARAEPVVAARIVAVMKGPISRTIARETIVPIRSCWLQRASSSPVWRERIIPEKQPTRRTTWKTRTLPFAICSITVAARRFAWPRRASPPRRRESE